MSFISGFAPLVTWEAVSFIGRGFWLTLRMAVAVIVLSFVFGVILGLARYSAHPLWGRLAAFYIETVRNLPLLLVMLFVRLKTGQIFVSFGFPAPVFWATVAGMTAFVCSVTAEIIRGGINSVDRGQWDAALAQGFSRFQCMRHIVLPQALRRMIPPLTSQFVTVVKDTSYAWALGLEEMTGAAVIFFTKHHNPMQTFLAVACVYFCVNFLMSLCARRMEARLARRAF
ncbi:MAG TPA: amino acid ABC transporter permease [Candidatus Acidoferrales bacterium]|nr:amino acid ABC transporter permease [Candidatus Acidoferrales bacterium]